MVLLLTSMEKQNMTNVNTIVYEPCESIKEHLLKCPKCREWLERFDTT